MLIRSRKMKGPNKFREQWIFFSHGGQVRGQFLIDFENYVSSLEIYPQYRGQGYGNLMIKEMTERFGHNLRYPLCLKVAVSNSIARHLYEKNGFCYTETDFTNNFSTYMVIGTQPKEKE